jgi:hypothetical protein
MRVKTCEYSTLLTARFLRAFLSSHPRSTSTPITPSLYLHPRSNIFRRYHGFVLEENTHDCALFVLNVPMLTGMMEERLKKARMPPEQQFCLNPVSKGSTTIQPEILQFLRIKHNLADGVDTEVEAKGHLLKELQLRMKGYKTTSKQDRKTLKKGGASMPFRKRMISMFMAGEKETLRSVIKQLEKEAKSATKAGSKEEL